MDRAQQVVQEALDVITTSRNSLFEAERIACWACASGLGTAIRSGRPRGAAASDRDGGASRRTCFQTPRRDRPWATWRDHNRYGDAHDLLSRVYQQFTEGFDTPDLKDARALLDDLEASGIRAHEKVPDPLSKLHERYIGFF